MRQRTIFDPAETGTVRAEKRRLSAQCRVILELLRQGDRSNAELARVALKYTGRISDLRKAGFDIAVTRRDRESGKTWYTLRNPSHEA